MNELGISAEAMQFINRMFNHFVFGQGCYFIFILLLIAVIGDAVLKALRLRCKQCKECD